MTGRINGPIDGSAVVPTDGPTEDDTQPRPLSPRSVILMISGVSCLVLATLIALLPVPYVIFSPGPVRNTLGDAPDGNPLIQVAGTDTYPTSGELDLTTISVRGGPLGELTIADVLSAWVDPTRSVRPVETVYPPQQTREEAEQEGVVEMESAQQAAAVAALTAAGVDVATQLAVVELTPDAPAADVILVDDVIESFDGVDVTGSCTLVDLVRSRAAGDVVPIGVERDGRRVDLDVELFTGDQGPIIGVLLDSDYDLPFEVDYDVAGIGGPSAGMMFALGIYDKITDGELTGGKVVAGTGTITECGVVGAIDGIQQKMVAAERHGADWFLAPADNCPDVAGAVPDGLQVIRISELAEAVAAVQAIADGDTTGLPGCG